MEFPDFLFEGLGTEVRLDLSPTAAAGSYPIPVWGIMLSKTFWEATQESTAQAQFKRNKPEVRVLHLGVSVLRTTPPSTAKERFP